MEIKKRKLEIKYDGQVFTLAYPSLKQLKEHQKSVKGIKDEDTTEYLQKFLEKLGLPYSVSDDMEADSIAEIVEIISGQKKA
jgi:division protein CdvB (Snf7/Vps24/ESCRT-III family)